MHIEQSFGLYPFPLGRGWNLSLVRGVSQGGGGSKHCFLDSKDLVIFFIEANKEMSPTMDTYFYLVVECVHSIMGYCWHKTH